MTPRQPAWRLAIRIILVCVAWVFALSVICVGLTFQPYILVVARNLTGAPVEMDLGVTGAAMGPRHMGGGGWAVGVLKVGHDIGVMTICSAGHAPPIRAETGYVTSSMQQLLVVRIKRCDDIRVDSHGVFEPLSLAMSKVVDLER